MKDIFNFLAYTIELGLDNCRDAIERRVRAYERRLHDWAEHEEPCHLDWASFLR